MKTDLFRGYVQTKNKKCTMKFKDNADLLTLNQAQRLDEYAGILGENTVLIDIDDFEQSEILMDIVEELQLNCKVIETTRGKHFIFHNSKRKLVDKCYTHTKLCCGLIADIKTGVKNSYEILKYNGEERFVIWDVEDDEDYQEIPMWLQPIKTDKDFLNMDEGSGRNNDLFGYEITLKSNGFTDEEVVQTIKLINTHVLKEPLSDDEIDTITRNDAIPQDIFFDGKKFLFNKFAEYVKSKNHIKRINGQLHLYKDGIYVSGYQHLENALIQIIPDLRKAQRTEVIQYLDIITPDETPIAKPTLIGFKNGILKLEEPKRKGEPWGHEILPFSPEIVITNQIPWDYSESVYSEICDNTLNKIACKDGQIRSLLEECIGYCFFRANELSKSFILTGSGSNGKSTFLDMVRNVLGRENYVSLDMDELSERFSTSAMFGKLANIGDDISDEFLQGKQISQFKKLVSGNDVKAENKGQDVFFFKPTVKLLFSANELPRFRNKGFYAIKRRLVIIPFNATFSVNDEDYDASIITKLRSQEVAEYLVRLGIEGLERVLERQDFTQSLKVKKQIDEFEHDNNPFLSWLDDVEPTEIVNHDVKSVYLRYSTFCNQNGFTSMAQLNFTKEVNKRLGFTTNIKRIKGERIRIFTNTK